MKQFIKNFLRNIPPFKQFLARMHNLENKLNLKLVQQQREIFSLKRLVENQSMDIDFLKKEVLRLNGRIDYANRQAEYLYYKGLHPDCYAAALEDWYYQRNMKYLDLENPRTYNEKLQWLKLYDNTPIKTQLVDKYLVRNWVAEKIGSDYLIPLLGVWNAFDEIDFSKLPNSFVLKTNHGSGWNLIVRDKEKLNIQQAKNKFDGWMKRNFAFHFGLELQYMNVPHKIIAEQYLEELDQVYDYKFMCFGGEVKFIWVDTDRFTDHKRTLFTVTWEKMKQTIKCPAADYDIPKPKNFEKMLELASILSEGFAHVRVDFYNINGKIYFGEMTFSSGSGTENATPKEFEFEMGSWITLPKKKPIPRYHIDSNISN